MKKFAAILLATAIPATAAPPSLATQIAAMKADMLEEADELFVRIWQDKAGGGYSADQFRSLARWHVLTRSYGLCLTNRTATDIAEWNVAMDRFVSMMGEGSEDLENSMRDMAGEWQADGIKARDDYTDAELVRECRVRMPAIRQLIRQI